MSMEFERKENRPFEVDETQKRRHPHEEVTDAKTVTVRVIISILLSLMLILTLAWTFLYTIAHGPSDDMREKFVRESYEAGAEWIPELVMPAEDIGEIMGKAGQ